MGRNKKKGSAPPEEAEGEIPIEDFDSLFGEQIPVSPKGRSSTMNHGQNGHPSIATPERRLLIAILVSAFRDIFLHEKEAKEEAINWIFSDEEGTSYHFIGVCEEIKVRATVLRRHVKERLT